MTICHTLTTNKTIERLVLSKKYKESCEKLEEHSGQTTLLVTTSMYVC